MRATTRQHTTIRNNHQNHPIVLAWRPAVSILLFAALCLILSTGTPQLLHAQESEPQTEEQKAAAKEAKESRESLTTLSQLLEGRRQQQATIKRLKAELRSAKEDVTKKEVEERLKTETERLAELENQISALTSGITEKDYYAREKEKFNLNEELQGLAEPFVKMIKSSTETAREIDNLQTTITEARRRQSIAKQAVERIDQLAATARDTNTASAKPTITHLKTQRSEWQKRLQEAKNLESTSQQQLALKEKVASRGNLESYATSFIRTRGVNLLIAIFSFFATFAILRLVDKTLSGLFHKRGMRHTFYSRLSRLLFQVFTVIASTLVMMITLNYLNDWILLGVAGLFTIALAWIGLKMLPVIIEQAVLLLNLGAVQEGERLLIEGVPWRVTKLDHYTELINPWLDGGHFTLPIRELVGRHSRPAARDEAWFPTKKDDWVQLENGTIAKVIFQTPELVQLVELGGARITYATTSFVEASPRNLSTGFRITQEFGLSYKHQKDATEKIPKLLYEHVSTGLADFIKEENIKDLQVELFRAGASSIDYEVEVDLDGKVAHRYEDIEGEITRLLIDAANRHDLEIPFPQMVLHQPASPASLRQDVEHQNAQ